MPLAERIREATTTDATAEALTEVTTAHDGILAALDEILTATADFHDGLGQAADPTSRGGCATSPTSTGASSAPTSPTPATRSPTGTHHTLGRNTCNGEVPATESERSAVCASPPPPRALPAPPPPVAAGLRR
ncbi:hypothetical protein [Streptomyces halstedii]|uniref:hypothetical protein n=1 Tax=Streptomyces halstedii TaxID=1944 RepID=UPI00367A8C6B